MLQRYLGPNTSDQNNGFQHVHTLPFVGVRVYIIRYFCFEYLCVYAAWTK